MEKNKNSQPIQDKTKKESNQKTNEDFNKKEIDPNFATSKKDYPEVSTKPNQKNYDLSSVSDKNKVQGKTIEPVAVKAKETETKKEEHKRSTIAEPQMNAETVGFAKKVEGSSSSVIKSKRK